MKAMRVRTAPLGPQSQLVMGGTGGEGEERTEHGARKAVQRTKDADFGNAKRSSGETAK